MVLRVCGFGDETAAQFPSTTLGGELFAAVKLAAGEMDSHVAARISGSSSARQGTASKAAVRASLREALEAIRDTARSMSLTIPGLETKFRIPRNMTDQELLATARAFATDAAALKSDFLRFAMPSDFIEDLDALADDFASAMGAQREGLGRQVMASSAFDDALERSLAATRQLDAVVRNTFRGDPARLAAWESARHVERAPRRKSPPPAAGEPGAKQGG
jgi:hypothetical protein